jgi:hypothetical protein
LGDAVHPGDWITVTSIVIGYALASLIAFFSLRQRVAMLELLYKTIDAKLDLLLTRCEQKPENPPYTPPH